VVGIESEHDLITTNQLPQPFFSVLQKVILAGGCKYFRTLAINFCTHEDLDFFVK
jgi:hypothetical protein